MFFTLFFFSWSFLVLVSNHCARFPLFQSNWTEITDNFDDMNLKETLLRGIYAYGFEKPSAIQQRAIIPCIKGTQPAFTSNLLFIFGVKWCFTIFRDLPNNGDIFVSTDHSKIFTPNCIWCIGFLYYAYISRTLLSLYNHQTQNSFH